MGILPPSIKGSWDENDLISKSLIIAFHQLREHDDLEKEIKTIKAQRPRLK